MQNSAMARLISLVVLFASSFLAQAGEAPPYSLLPDTPPYVCERLIYGDKWGSSYDSPTFRRIQTLVHWRYDVELIGFEETLGNGKGGAFLIPNHSTPADPGVVLTAIGARTSVRPLVTGNLKHAPGLAPIFHATNAFLQPEPISGGRTAVTLLEALIREMANAVHHGDNVLFYPSGYAQTQAYDHLEAQTMVHRLLAIDPDARFVLMRQRGLWGSSFGHGAWSSLQNHKVSTNAAIARGLLNGVRIGATNGPLTPKRKVVFEFVEPKDFPRRGTVAEINAYLTKFYGEGLPEQRTFVKGHFLLPWTSPRTTEKVIDYGRAPQRWARNVADPAVPVDLAVRATLVDIFQTEFGLNESDRFAAHLDSIARVQLFLAIEERLGVRFPDDGGFGDIDDLARQITLLRQQKTNVEQAIEASAKWFAPATNVSKSFLSSPLGRLPAFELAHKLKKWDSNTIGVLRPLNLEPTVMEWAIEQVGKTAVIIDPEVEGRSMRRQLDEAGISQILTTPEYLKEISVSLDLSQYFERFVMVDTLEPQL